MKRAFGFFLILIGCVALYDLWYGGHPSDDPRMAGWLILLLVLPGVWLARKRKP